MDMAYLSINTVLEDLKLLMDLGWIQCTDSSLVFIRNAGIAHETAAKEENQTTLLLCQKAIQLHSSAEVGEAGPELFKFLFKAGI